MAHREGNNHPAGTPVADVRRFTPGKYVALGQTGLTGTGVKMLDTDGERAEFIFNDDRKAGKGLMGVGLMSPWDSSEPADAIRVLAGGVVAELDYCCVKMSEEDDLPKFVSIDDAEAGWWVTARANFGNTASGEDLADADGNYHPTLTVHLLGQNSFQVGTEAVPQAFPTALDLAAIDADDEVVVRWTPGYAGKILSDYFQVTEAVTTAAKATTFKLFINGVAVTGGNVVVTSALATPDGASIPGSAITGTNTFDANDEITVVTDDVTAFVEGAGNFVIRVTAPTEQV